MRHKRLRLPSLASEVAWLADKTLQQLGLYNQKIHVLSEMNKTIACSVEKARKRTRYRPAVALEEGMRRSLKWTIEKEPSLSTNMQNPDSKPRDRRVRLFRLAAHREDASPLSVPEFRPGRRPRPARRR